MYSKDDHKRLWYSINHEMLRKLVFIYSNKENFEKYEEIMNNIKKQIEYNGN